MSTIRAALQAASHVLATSSPSARLDAEILLAHVLSAPRSLVIAEGQRVLTDAERATFEQLIERRAALEPVAYLVGRREFFGLDFMVDWRVLVPRPETELIVELALRRLQARGLDDPLIADIGTGSGCLAVTLAALLQRARVYAVDLSRDALEVARANAERHGVADRVLLLNGAGCAPLPETVDLLVSNPPYTVLDEVDENVRRWEPQEALDGGADRGFAIPAEILRESSRYLRPRGSLLMEIGAWQGEQAQTLGRELFPTARIAVERDLAGLERVLAIDT